MIIDGYELTRNGAAFKVHDTLDQACAHALGYLAWARTGDTLKIYKTQYDTEADRDSVGWKRTGDSWEFSGPLRDVNTLRF